MADNTTPIKTTAGGLARKMVDTCIKGHAKLACFFKKLKRFWCAFELSEMSGYQRGGGGVLGALEPRKFCHGARSPTAFFTT